MAVRIMAKNNQILDDPDSGLKQKPNIIQAESIGHCWLACTQFVLTHGRHHHDEDVGLLEVLGLSVEVLVPDDKDPIIETHGDSTVISRTLAKFSKGAHMPDRPFTYGERIYAMAGTNQFDWMAARLLSKPGTKSATIGLLVPGSESSNLPCLTTIDAKIRNNKLELQFFFRSQNVFGRQYANLMSLARLQKDLADECGVMVGALRGYIASAHIYSFDVGDARRLCNRDSLKIVDRYYECGPSSIRSDLG